MRKAVAGGDAYNVDRKTKNKHAGELFDGSKACTRLEARSHGNAIKVECRLVFAAPDAGTGKHTTGWVKASALSDSVNRESWNPTIAGKHCKVTDATDEVTDTA